MIPLLQTIRQKAALLGLDWFIFALAAIVFAAWLGPGFGTRSGFFSMETLGQCGVFLIFFFYGLRLSVRKLLAGLRNWQLPIVVHLSTFVLFPVLILIAYSLFATDATRELWLGVFYLSVLPSTVSTSVVMVSIARGNFAAAVFNAGISSIFGVFITPLWMSLFLSTSGKDFELTSTVLQLVAVVLFPIVLGMLLMPSVLGRWAETYRKSISRFDQCVILLIVYTAFCKAFTMKSFEGFGFGKLAWLTILLAVLFFAVFSIISLICRLLKFNREDRIAVVFCGSKKSMMHGTAMAKVLFPDPGAIGVVLLPLMIYHALQIILASIIARSMARRQEADCMNSNRQQRE